MSSVLEDIIDLTQEADRLTAYYIKRIKKYGKEATRTEVAKGEARPKSARWLRTWNRNLPRGTACQGRHPKRFAWKTPLQNGWQS